MIEDLESGQRDAVIVSHLDVVSAMCVANNFTTPYGYPYGVGVSGGVFVTNNTTDRILVTTQPMADPGYTWLDAHETDAPVFGVGEWVNEGNATDLGGGSMWTFAILNHGGISATGTLARSAAVNPGDPTFTGGRDGRVRIQHPSQRLGHALGVATLNG